MAAFSNLFQPGRIGSLELKNRIIMAPMGSNFAESDGSCGERIQAYYEARAAGGAALLTMGVCSIAYPAGTAEPYQVGVSDDKYIPGLTALADRVHKHGAKIAMQLQHAGKTSVRDLAEGRELWVPSIPPAIKTDMMASLTREELGAFISSSKGARKPDVKIRVMDKADIKQMVVWFADAAERAKKCGFDGLEIHAAHTYIIAGFLSAYYNKRDDEYGGSLQNRARLLMEVIAAIRERLGANYPLWLRLDACELRTPGGITIEDAKAVAKMVEQAGVDAISVSAYANTSTGVAFTEAPLVQKKAGFLQWANEIKGVVSIPVIVAGRLDPDVADTAIASKQCDYVAMGRQMLADPELPIKLIENRAPEIRPCIYCYTCVSQIFVNKRVKCAVNPGTGHEAENVLQPADKPRHILVVGGGPAGMEAARVAAERGHRVTLVERSARLGGTLFFAALAYPENGELLDYLVNQMQRLCVDVRLNTTATVELVNTLAVDNIIVAVGAKRNAPPIPGGDSKHVWSGDELRRLMTGDRADEIAKGKLSLGQRTMMKAGSLVGVTDSTDAIQKLSHLWMPLGKKIVIIGGGLVGLELAEFLIERDRNVVVLEEGPSLGSELSIVRRWRVLDNLKEQGVDLLTNIKVSAISDKTVDYLNKDEVCQQLEADSVVLAIGASPDDSVAKSFQDCNVPVTNIGDGAEIGFIEGAIQSGFDAARCL